MKYRSRELRRMYEIEVYDGDPDHKKTKTGKHTAIAWNEVGAVRACGNKKVAKPPEFLYFVSWDDPPRRIDDTSGPKKAVKPSIKHVEPQKPKGKKYLKDRPVGKSD